MELYRPAKSNLRLYGRVHSGPVLGSDGGMHLQHLPKFFSQKGGLRLSRAHCFKRINKRHCAISKLVARLRPTASGHMTTLVLSAHAAHIV